jgi:hypothetical protein
LKLDGQEHGDTLLAANNYALLLNQIKRFEEAKSLLRKVMPVARRVLGQNSQISIAMRVMYAKALYIDCNVTLDDLREAVTTLEETERTARRVLGATHHMVEATGRHLRSARAAQALRSKEI